MRQDEHYGLKEQDIIHAMVSMISESKASPYVVYAACSGRKI